MIMIDDDDDDDDGGMYDSACGLKVINLYLKLLSHL